MSDSAEMQPIDMMHSRAFLLLRKDVVQLQREPLKVYT